MANLKKNNDEIISTSKLILLLVVIVIVGLAIMLSIGDKTYKSSHGFFQITVPAGYNFKENKNAHDDYIFAKVDKKRWLYIFGLAFDNSKVDTFRDVAEDSYKKQALNVENINNVSELVPFSHDEYNAYVYTYTYTDAQGHDYYAERYYINCSNGYYMLLLESLLEDKEFVLRDFETIAKSFKEIG